MTQDTYYVIEVKKITKGIKEQNEYVQIYASEHPKLKEPDPPDQYGYRSVIKSFSETEKILEQRCDSVDVERILKAVNKGL